MQRIFMNEWSEGGQIWSNPYGTLPILFLDIVANRLKWLALQHVSRPASNKMVSADAEILILDRSQAD